MFEFQFFDFRYSKLDEVRLVVRRVVVLGRAGGCDIFLLLHCTSCLFDNSSVKLWKHDTPLLFAPQGANYEQGLGWGHGCKAKNTPVGCFSGSAVCAANGGALPRQAIPQQDHFGNAGALQK